MSAEVGELAAMLRQLAKARLEYADGPHAEVIRHEAEVLEFVGAALAGDGVDLTDLVSCYAPSWRWPEFGEWNPLPSLGRPA